MTFEQIQEKGQHLTCPCYENKEKPLIEILDCRSDSFLTRNQETDILVAIWEGSLELTTGFNHALTINQGNLFLIPKGTKFTLHFFEETRLIFFKITKEVDFCLLVHKSASFFEELRATEMITLQINTSIRALLKQFIIAYEQGLRCGHYLVAKMTELIVIISAYYPLDMVTQFFLPILSPDALFKMTVMANKNKIFNVTQYAELTHLTIDTFRTRFKLTFHKTPKEWIEEERKKLIFSELTERNKSLKEIAYFSGFNSEAELIKFCHKKFNKTPLSIRMEL
jgi:AraC-like DNA-binding protein